jgi:hypothetical protein
MNPVAWLALAADSSAMARKPHRRDHQAVAEGGRSAEDPPRSIMSVRTLMSQATEQIGKESTGETTLATC